MKKVVTFYFLVFFIFTGRSIAVEGPEELYVKANSSYENMDYEKAASLYEGLLRMDNISPEVFYNLGNSYFKLKKIGKAILNYERALRLDPRDRDIRLNLKIARSMAIDKINTPEKGFILGAILFLYDRMTANELAAMCSLFYLAVVLFLILSIKFIAKRRLMFYTAAAFGAVVFILIIFLSVKINKENFTKTGIIVAEKIDVRSGPKEDYLLQFTLHEGAKVSIVKDAQNWYEIELSKDLKGWIPKPSVDII
ncbi:MAG: tetratricopeptide repeat protein [Candidatus Omnitrophica bacterium]|nr:tetratricopeptide repeat protein [Candidatus Omnitrophota bacterium]